MWLGGGRWEESPGNRNVEEQVRSTCGKAAHFAGIDGFITDKNAEGIPVRKLPDDVLVSFVEATHIASDAPDHAMDQRKRLVLAKRNKMDFVIYEYTLALRVKKQSACVRQKGALRNHIRRVPSRF